MDLWIRSQDKKKLHNIKHLELDNNETGIFNTDTYTLLGKYNSKERALEVLDEIQNIFKPPLIIQKTEGFITTADNSMHIINPTYSDIKELSTIVYEMPEE